MFIYQAPSIKSLQRLKTLLKKEWRANRDHRDCPELSVHPQMMKMFFRDSSKIPMISVSMICCNHTSWTVTVSLSEKSSFNGNQILIRVKLLFKIWQPLKHAHFFLFHRTKLLPWILSKSSFRTNHVKPFQWNTNRNWRNHRHWKNLR